ncbi:MAG TPA: serpin family protein [archaeon]|jgi:serpin B|nr:serpin family protein [archaeon]HPV65951.1 serpin family protein [archaeon]
MNKKILIILFVLLFVGAATAGAVVFLKPYNPTSPPSVNSEGSTPDGLSQVVISNNKFNIDLYKKVATTENNNIFFSSYSIFSALAMTYEGADGTTAQQMKDVFYFPENEVLRPNFAELYNRINKKDKRYELRTGNALWAQKDYKFLDSYFSNVEKYYGGKAVNLDFINETELSRNTINKFIEEQTNNRIKNIIPSGELNPLTRLVISNAIYFKGKWEVEFDKKDTQNRDFKAPTGTIKVPMMFMAPKKENFNYYENDNLQVLELPYKDKELSMVVLLPKEEYGLSNLEKDMDFEKLNEWTKNLRLTKVDQIYLPKLEFEKSTRVVEPLKELGMVNAFSTENADFSKMTGTKDLYISNILHKAFIKVDEQGTEATAATVVMMDRMASAGFVFNADHPFIFFIRENSTGAILFMGRITNPSA